jgi:hypothetical protein
MEHHKYLILLIKMSTRANVMFSFPAAANVGRSHGVTAHAPPDVEFRVSAGPDFANILWRHALVSPQLY